MENAKYTFYVLGRMRCWYYAMTNYAIPYPVRINFRLTTKPIKSILVKLLFYEIAWKVVYLGYKEFASITFRSLIDICDMKKEFVFPLDSFTYLDIINIKFASVGNARMVWQGKIKIYQGRPLQLTYAFGRNDTRSRPSGSISQSFLVSHLYYSVATFLSSTIMCWLSTQLL